MENQDQDPAAPVLEDTDDGLLPLAGRESQKTRRGYLGGLSRPRRALLIAVLLGVNAAMWPWVISKYRDQARVRGRLTFPFANAERGAGHPHAAEVLGFDISNATIPKDEILGGGPPKDGIPAILDPKFVAARDADYMRDDDLVLGYVHGGAAHAYPLRILVWHEIVNDTVGDRPIAATYCPLCGTCMVFDRRTPKGEISFGVSGLLYNSDVLMYDHQTDSLWSQLKMESVAGPRAGEKLAWLPAEQMTWKAWKERYPDSEVLSTDTGYGRDYDRLAYQGYMNSDTVMFPIKQNRQELAQKAWVVGVIVDGVPKAYPIQSLEALDGEPLNDTVGNTGLRVAYDAAAKRASFQLEDGTSIPHVAAYWFAWQAFYPDTELHTAKQAEGSAAL